MLNFGFEQLENLSVFPQFSVSAFKKEVPLNTNYSTLLLRLTTETLNFGGAEKIIEFKPLARDSGKNRAKPHDMPAHKPPEYLFSASFPARCNGKFPHSA
jgi:hypothetical protein